MTSHVLSGLVDKRGEIAGEIEVLRRQLGTLEASAHHLDQTILLFNPNYKPQEIKARRKVRPNRWFAKGEASQLTLSALQTCQDSWVPTPEVVDSVLKLKGLDELTGQDRDGFSSSVAMALNRYVQRGIVERSSSTGAHGEYSWRLTPSLFSLAGESQ